MSKEKTTAVAGEVKTEKGIYKLDSDYVIDGNTVSFYKSVLELMKTGKSEKYEFTSIIEFPRPRLNSKGENEDRDDIIVFVLKTGGYINAKARHNKS